MAEIGADYLGGDPSVPGGNGTSGKLIAQDGAVSFDGQFIDSTLKNHPVTVVIPESDIRAISVGSANRMSTLTRTVVGGVLGGGVGAIIGAATGKRNHIFPVACRRDDFDFLCSFGVRGDEGTSLLNAMQAGQQRRGVPPIPKVEDLAGKKALDASERQVEVLEQILDQLCEQTALLRALATGGGS